ncbi:hypothetical protein HJC23_006308 [Cyclotella cryptica]|uniref:PDZ domain-containing protein n=1 Tax=Cyclotella cryptica TaxID=29204 RepID=A0ABD3PCD6_9STRA
MFLTQQYQPSLATRLLTLALGFAVPRITVQFTPSLSRTPCVHNAIRTTIALKSESQSSNLVDYSEQGVYNLRGALANCALHEFVLKNHKPLGCSVEESLASEPDGAKHVFVAQASSGVQKIIHSHASHQTIVCTCFQLNEGGNADQAGLEVGDVIVQLSGTFDEVIDVAGLGLDKIRSLVSGRLKEQTLTIRVARGSDVMERHETALVDLCILGEDANTVNCITAIHSPEDGAYFTDNDIAMDCQDSDVDCMLDSLWDTWSDGLPIKNLEEEETAEEPKEEKKKVAPWASRSSGSGTWVRDPATGQMRNIDE